MFRTCSISRLTSVSDTATVIVRVRRVWFLSRGYGDCKDKATLMRAMLRVLKIESYAVLIFSGDPTYVREEWIAPAI